MALEEIREKESLKLIINLLFKARTRTRAHVHLANYFYKMKNKNKQKKSIYFINLLNATHHGKFSFFCFLLSSCN